MSRRATADKNSHAAAAAAAEGAATAAADSASAPAPASASGVPARFAGKTAYEVLGVSRTATADEIKKAYRRMALSCHPDLNRSPTATAEFQHLSRCHELLSDPRRRQRYDATGMGMGGEGEEGEDGTDDGGESSMDAYEYWRSIFPAITAADIESYRATYIGGAEEREDVCAAWDQHGGDLSLIMECVPFADSESVARLCQIIREERGVRVPAKTQKEVARALRSVEGDEAEEAEEALQQLSANEQRLMRASMNGGGSGRGSQGASAGGDESALALIIAQRARDRAQAGRDFMAHMEAKYAQTSAGGKRKRSSASGSSARDQPPSEEEFSRTQARVQQRQADKAPNKKRKQ